MSASKNPRKIKGFQTKSGGAVALGVELDNPNRSTIDYTQEYIFINGVAGIIARYVRPEPNRLNYYRKRDEHGNFCK